MLLADNSRQAPLAIKRAAIPVKVSIILILHFVFVNQTTVVGDQKQGSFVLLEILETEIIIFPARANERFIEP